MSEDVPVGDAPELGLTFVDPHESDATFRVVVWGPPGEGKSVAAASAPGPILVISADRPGAYRTPRRLHAGKPILETRYTDSTTLREAYRFLRDHPTGQSVRTVVLDPVGGIYDRLVEQGPKRSDGEPDYQWVNKRLLGFIYALREFGVHLVLVAHERLNDGKKGDGKLYPAIGGPSLINRVLAEMDIVAHVEREQTQGAARYMAQLAPRGNLVGKDATDALGERRELNLTEWFTTAVETSAAEESDLPWSPDFQGSLQDAAHAAEATGEPDPAEGVEPGSVPTPRLTSEDPDENVAKLRERGCICPSPLRPDGWLRRCPIKKHHDAGGEDPEPETLAF